MSNEIEQSFYDDNEYKSERYPNLSGGQEDAAASPDERDDKKGIDRPRSTVALHRQQVNLQRAIHGEHEPKSHLPVLTNIHRTLIESLKTLKDIKELLAYNIPLGQLRAFSIAFPSASVFTHIEFTDSTQTVGLPSGVFVNEPNRKVCRLRIFNDGPTGAIKYSSNLPRSDKSAEFQINVGEFDDSLNFEQPLVWSLNIVVLSGAPTVRVLYVV